MGLLLMVFGKLIGMIRKALEANSLEERLNSGNGLEWMPASRRSPIDIISMFLWLVPGRIEH